MVRIRRLKRLSSVTAIVRAYQRVHGAGSFRRLIGRTKQQIANYKACNELPSETFLIVTSELKRLRCCAPAALWGIKEVPKARAREPLNRAA